MYISYSGGECGWGRGGEWGVGEGNALRPERYMAAA